MKIVPVRTPYGKGWGVEQDGKRLLKKDGKPYFFIGRKAAEAFLRQKSESLDKENT